MDISEGSKRLGSGRAEVKMCLFLLMKRGSCSKGGGLNFSTKMSRAQSSQELPLIVGQIHVS